MKCLALALVVLVAAINAQYSYNMCVTSLASLTFCNCATLMTDCPGLPNVGKQQACYTRCANFKRYATLYWKRACNCSRCQLKCASTTTAAATTAAGR